MPEENCTLPPEEELEEEFVRTASGPGGQNVNKTSTAVRLVWRFQESTFLGEDAKTRLKQLCGADFLSILARESRSLPENRRIARERLREWIRRASAVPRKRKKTQPTRASRERRLQAKKNRSGIKAGRARISGES